MKKLFLGAFVFALCALAVPSTTLAQRRVVAGDTPAGTAILSGDDGTALAATTGTATSTVHAATLNTDSGKITTESITTAAAGAATYTFTLTDSKIASTSKVFVSLETASAGTPVVTSVAPGSGTCDIKIQNAHPTAAFNSTFKISFLVAK